MKKLKIMLLSFALLAIVGGALAFKAKLGPINYCTSTLEAGPHPDFCKIESNLKACPNKAPGIDDGTGDFYCYTIDDDGTFDCKINGGSVLPCTTTTNKLNDD